MEPAAVNPGWRKSSHSSNGGGSCVEVGAIPWRKSSYSDNGGGSCVEAGHLCDSVLIRDTTQHGAGPVLRVSAETWRAFTTAVRDCADLDVTIG
jgi:hypothetical protein